MEDEEGEELGCFSGRGGSDYESTEFQKSEFKKACLFQWLFYDIFVSVLRLLILNDSLYSYKVCFVEIVKSESWMLCQPHSYQNFEVWKLKMQVILIQVVGNMT